MNWNYFYKFLSFCPPELAHDVAVKFLKYEFNSNLEVKYSPLTVSNLRFRNPIGLAAGFDKNAECINGISKVGFSHTEVGTITINPQYGNSKPRVFRLNNDEAIINRYGFNSKGIKKILENLKKNSKKIVIGTNIGPNKNSTDKIKDYYLLSKLLSKYSDYLTVNISSPNTIGLRNFQYTKSLEEVIQAVNTGLKESGFIRPIFLKFSPDIKNKDLLESINLACSCKINGFVLTNTTTSRPKNLLSSNKFEEGGLSGKPIKYLASEKLFAVNKFLKESNIKDISLIGVGGIGNAEDVLMRIILGADLVQIYTSLIYQGPNLIQKIMNKLYDFKKVERIQDFSEIKGTAKSVSDAEKRVKKISNEIHKNNYI